MHSGRASRDRSEGNCFISMAMLGGGDGDAGVWMIEKTIIELGNHVSTRTIVHCLDRAIDRDIFNGNRRKRSQQTATKSRFGIELALNINDRYR